MPLFRSDKFVMVEERYLNHVMTVFDNLNVWERKTTIKKANNV